MCSFVANPPGKGRGRPGEGREVKTLNAKRQGRKPGKVKQKGGYKCGNCRQESAGHRAATCPFNCRTCSESGCTAKGKCKKPTGSKQAQKPEATKAATSNSGL